MSNLLKEVQNAKHVMMRLKASLIEECVIEYLVEEYDIANILNVDKDSLEEKLRDSLSLYSNDWSDIAIKFISNEDTENERDDEDNISLDPIFKSIEDKLRADNLITEGDCNRATNLCCKAMSTEFDCAYEETDIWIERDEDYVLVQLPKSVVNQ